MSLKISKIEKKVLHSIDYIKREDFKGKILYFHTIERIDSSKCNKCKYYDHIEERINHPDHEVLYTVRCNAYNCPYIAPLGKYHWLNCED